MGKELLLEIGTEEIPAGFLPKACRDMDEMIRREFATARIAHGQVRTMATPRRLVLYVEREDLSRATTMAFTVMVLAELFQAFNARSLYESSFSRHLHRNPSLIWAVFGSFALQMILIYVPFLHRIFGTESLSLLDIGVGIALASVTLWFTEIVKFFRRRNNTCRED